MKLQRRRMVILAIVVVCLCVAVCGVVIWRVEHAVRSTEYDVAQRELLGLEVRTLGTQPNLGFEGMTAPAIYKSVAAYQGKIYLAGPAGLYAYSSDGSLNHIYRAGIDLPAAPLGQMTVGMLVGSRQPELLIATLCEGVLAFDGQTFRQIRPTQDEARAVTALLPLASGRLLIGTAKLGLLI